MDFSDNLFHKIIQGTVPSFKVYEDDDFLVILDRFPVHLGHCLILPKIPSVDIYDLDDRMALGMYPLAKRIARAVRDVTGCDGVYALQNNGKAAGQVVFYFHLHIVPCYADADNAHHAPRKDYPTEQFEDMANRLSAYLREG